MKHAMLALALFLAACKDDPSPGAPRTATEKLQEGARQAAEGAKDLAGEGAEKVKEAGHAIGEAARENIPKLESRLRELDADLGRAMDRVATAPDAAARDAAEKTVAKLKEAKESVENNLENARANAKQ